MQKEQNVPDKHKPKSCPKWKDCIAVVVLGKVS